jgi:hypothetical protein
VFGGATSWILSLWNSGYNPEEGCEHVSRIHRREYMKSTTTKNTALIHFGKRHTLQGYIMNKHCCSLDISLQHDGRIGGLKECVTYIWSKSVQTSYLMAQITIAQI